MTTHGRSELYKILSSAVKSCEHLEMLEWAQAAEKRQQRTETDSEKTKQIK